MQFDEWLTDDGPAALVIREHLVPVQGADGVLFPATFAPEKGADRDKSKFQGGYNIDSLEGEFSARITYQHPGDRRLESDLRHNGGGNVCLVDSVGSQANRIEPLFAKGELRALVPQIEITVNVKSVDGEEQQKTISLLEAGHRAGDAIVRSTKLQSELRTAFKAIQAGNAEPLAKIAPTSLVFGVWDSRDTQAKVPRLISSTIRAFDVQKLTRSAQYTPPLDYAAADVFSEEDREKAEGDSKNPLAKRGFVHVPAPAAPGGVIATGGVRRESMLSLSALRLLAAGTDAEKTLSLRRYVLGLSLVALTANPPSYLRQGCDLVPDVDKPREFVLVHGDGRREKAEITQKEALAFAAVAAKAFGVGKDQTVPFDKELAKKDVAGDGDGKKQKAPKKGAKS